MVAITPSFISVLMTSGRAGGHAVGQFLHGDLLRQDDVTHHLHLIGPQPVQFRLTALALALAADRGERADLLVLALDRRLHVDAAGAAAVAGAFLRRHDRRFARRQTAGTGTPHRTRLVVVFGARAPVRSRSVSVAADGAPCRPVACASPVVRPAPGQRAVAPVPVPPDRRGRRCKDGDDEADKASSDSTVPSDDSGSADGAARPCARPRPLPPAWLALPPSPARPVRGPPLPPPRGLLLRAARLLGGGQDRNLLLLAALGVALRGVALLFDQCALPRRLLGRGQRPTGTSAPAGAGNRSPRRGRSSGRCRRWCSRGGRWGRRQRRALLAHFHLHDFRPAVAEALPDGSRIDGPPQFQPSCRT